MFDVVDALLGGCFSRHDDAGEGFELDNEQSAATQDICGLMLLKALMAVSGNIFFL